MYSDGLLHQRGFPKGLGTSQFSSKEQGILFFYQLNGYWKIKIGKKLRRALSIYYEKEQLSLEKKRIMITVNND